MSRGGLLVQALSSEDLLSDDSGNTHHGSTSVVELSVLLTNLLGRFLLPVVDLSKPNTVVTIELGGRPPGKLNESHDHKDLSKSSRGNLEKSTNSRINVGELQVVGRGKIPIEGPLVVVDESSKHSHHGNTSVLALNGSVAGEFLVIGDVSKRIEETEGGGSTNLLFRNLEGGAGFNLVSAKERKERKKSADYRNMKNTTSKLQPASISRALSPNPNLPEPIAKRKWNPGVAFLVHSIASQLPETFITYIVGRSKGSGRAGNKGKSGKLHFGFT